MPHTIDSEALEANAAAEGLGIVRVPEFLVSDHVSEGRLIEILADCRSDPLSISLLYPHRRFNPAKIRLFADFMQAHFAEQWAETA